MAQVHPVIRGVESEEQMQEKLLGQDEGDLNEGQCVCVWTLSDTKAVTCHLPQAVGCPASLQATITLENMTLRFFCQTICDMMICDEVFL